MTHKHTPKYIQLTENASPSTPPSGHVAIYSKSDGLWYQTDSAGTETRLSQLVVRDDLYRAGDTNTDLYTNYLVLPYGSFESYAAGITRISLLTNTRQRRFMAVTPAGDGAVNSINYGTASWANPASMSTQADSFYEVATTLASIGSLAGAYTGGTYAVDASCNPTFECVMRTSTVITQARIWVGLMGQTPPNNTGVSTVTTAFLYSLAGGWKPVTHNGSTQTTGTDIGTVAVSTRYLLRIRVVGSNAYFSVDNGAEQTISTTVPTSGRMGMVCAIISTSTAARTILMSRMQVEADA